MYYLMLNVSKFTKPLPGKKADDAKVLHICHSFVYNNYLKISHNNKYLNGFNAV